MKKRSKSSWNLTVISSDIEGELMTGQRAGMNTVRAKGKGCIIRGRLHWDSRKLSFLGAVLVKNPNIQIINGDCRWECWCYNIIKFYHVQSCHCQHIEWRDWFTSSECTSNLIITYVFQIGHSVKPGFIIIICACWTYQHLGSQGVLINHITLLILYTYCDCNLCVSLYLFPCLALFLTMRKIYIFFQHYFDLNKDCLTAKWIMSIWTSWAKVVFREIWHKFFRCPHLLNSLLSEFNTEGKPHSSDLMAKAVSEKTLWGT